MNLKKILNIKDLSVSFNNLKIVNNISFSIFKNEIVGMVGESGSGKSMIMMALLGLISSHGTIKAKKIIFNKKNFLTISNKERRSIIGKDISIIFQDVLNSLNPSYTIGYQIKEILKLHENLHGKKLNEKLLLLLEQVGISDAEKQIKKYPHQISGGMNQRVMIAMAIACNPKLLIADEPTTALDVIVQSQIIELLKYLQKKNNMSLILISHDLAIISEIAKRVIVMYSGEIVEINRIPDIFIKPYHPYTKALLGSIINTLNNKKKLLVSLKGSPPNIYDRQLHGCLFASRCEYTKLNCIKLHPILSPVSKFNNDIQVRCIYPLN